MKLNLVLGLSMIVLILLAARWPDSGGSSGGISLCDNRNLEFPSVGDDAKFYSRVGRNAVATELYCATDVGTVSINMEARTVAGTPVSPILTADLDCTSAGVSTSSFALPSLPADSFLTLRISALTGAPTILHSFLRCN